MRVSTLVGARRSPPSPGGTRPVSGGGRGEAARSLLVCGALAALVLAFYVATYPVRGVRVPLGSDTPVYIWWARFAGAEGIGAFRTGGRPGIVGLLATLATVTRFPESAVAVAAGPVLAAAAALAAAAWGHSSLGRDRLRFALMALLTGSFLSLMVQGYLSTLAFSASFLAALACLAFAIDGRAWAPAAGGGLLLAAGGSAHPAFLLLAAPVLAGVLLALVPAWRRDAKAGIPRSRRGIARVLLASLGGAGVAGAGIGLASIGTAERTVYTGRDMMNARHGLTAEVARSFKQKLFRDFPWFRFAAFTGAALTSLAARGRTAEEGSNSQWIDDRRAAFWGAQFAWLAVTAVGAALLLSGMAVGGQRLVAFCIPLSVLAAIGARALLAPGGRRRALPIAAGGLAVASFVVAAWVAWHGQDELVSADALSQARALGFLVGREPGTRPVVVIMNDESERPALSVIRRENYLRQEVPAGRVDDLYVFVGTPRDFLASRPTVVGHREHDLLSRDYWSEIAPLLSERPFVVVLDEFDSASYRQALTVPGARRVGPGMVALPGFGPSARAIGSRDPALRQPGPGPISPWLPVWFAPALLALAGAVGWPWARVALPHADPPVPIALAPAFGLGVVALAAVAVEAAGLRLSGPAGWFAFVLAVAAGIAAFALRAGARAPEAGSVDAGQG